MSKICKYSITLVQMYHYCHYRLAEREEDWKADVEAAIAIKDSRSRMIQMEKEENMMEVSVLLTIAVFYHLLFQGKKLSAAVYPLVM